MKVPFWELGRPVDEVFAIDGWTIPAIIAQRSVADSDKAVFSLKQGSAYRDITWRTLGHEVSVITLGLRAMLGLSAQTRIAIIGKTSLDWVYCDFAVLSAGCVTVGIYDTNSSYEIAHSLAVTESSAVIVETADGLTRVLDALGDDTLVRACILMDESPIPEHSAVPVIRLSEIRRRGAECLAADAQEFARCAESVDPAQPARIIFTSGTSGPPKAALFTHRGWLTAAEQSVFRYPEMRHVRHRSVALLSIAHVSSAMTTEVVPLISELQPHFDPGNEVLADLIRDVRPNFLALTPRFFQKLAVQILLSNKEWSRWRRATYGAAMWVGLRVIEKRWAKRKSGYLLRLTLSASRRYLFRPMLAAIGMDQILRAQTGSAMYAESVASLWAVWGVDVRQSYGLTETAGAITYQQEPFPSPNDIGNRLLQQPDTEVELADDGEILFRSPMLFECYLNNPVATATALSGGWFHTGDLGEWDEWGALKLIGRKNDAFNTAGGKTINPSEVERPVYLSPYIARVVVYGSGEKYITALIEPDFEAIRDGLPVDDLTKLSEQELRSDLRLRELISDEIQKANRHLARVEQIKDFVIPPYPLDSVPDALTASGKLRRSIIHEHFGVLLKSMYSTDEEDLINDATRGARRS